MATFTGVSAECAFSFGRFRLLPGEQILLEDEKPVRLGSRALDILTMLVEHAGELVSRDQLTSRVWPDTFVEESSLRVHIRGLRRALGDGHAGNRYVANRRIGPHISSPFYIRDREWEHLIRERVRFD